MLTEPKLGNYIMKDIQLDRRAIIHSGEYVSDLIDDMLYERITSYIEQAEPTTAKPSTKRTHEDNDTLWVDVVFKPELLVLFESDDGGTLMYQTFDGVYVLKEDGIQGIFDEIRDRKDAIFNWEGEKGEFYSDTTIEDLISDMGDGDVVIVEPVGLAQMRHFPIPYIRDTQDRDIWISSIEAAKEYFLDPEEKYLLEIEKDDSDLLVDDKETYKNNYRGWIDELKDAHSLEDFCDVFNACPDDIGGHHLYVEELSPDEAVKNHTKPYIGIVFDVETTGLDRSNDEITQISIIDLDGNILLNTYVKPLRHTEWPDAEAINGISPAMVADAPTLDDLAPQIKSIFDDADIVIGYNSKYFDSKFLEKIVDFNGKQHYDVMLEFAPVYGQWDEKRDGYKRQKLSRAAEYYGYGDFGAHDSLEDIKATLFVYKNLTQEQRLPEIEPKDATAAQDHAKSKKMERDM